MGVPELDVIFWKPSRISDMLFIPQHGILLHGLQLKATLYAFRSIILRAIYAQFMYFLFTRINIFWTSKPPHYRHGFKSFIWFTRKLSDL